jgi:predicted cupin superfamily sugar epimerase
MAPDDAGPITSVVLGPDVLADQTPQQVVPAHAWQAAVADQGWTLVSCVVAPGFDFAGFELAAPAWQPGFRS